MKKNKKILFAATLFSLSAIPVASVSIVKSISATEQNVTKKSEETQAVTNPTVGDVEFRLNKDYKTLSWYNKEFSNQVTEAQLKELLLPNFEYGVNYGILIETPTATNGDLTNGYVNFAVYIRNNTITDGVPEATDSSTLTFITPPDNIKLSDGTTPSTAISMQAYSQSGQLDVDDEINGVTLKRKNIWTTKNITNLFLPYKYSFSWNSNDKIGDFLKETDKQVPTSTVTQDDSDTYLTAQDVYNNMIATSSQTDLLPDDTITKAIKISTSNDDLKSYGISSTDAQKYGIALIEVNFNNSAEGNSADSWANGVVPNEKYLVRGLDNSSGDKEEMQLNLESNTSTFLNTSFDVSKIKAQNPNFTLPQNVSSSSTIKVSDFTPTQLINALVTNQNGSSNLLNLLAGNDYLSSSSTLPAIYLSYMGSNQYKVDSSSTDSSEKSTTSSTWGGTGLFQQGNIYSKTNGEYSASPDKNAATSSQITAISASSDDSTGTLYLKVTYNCYNVYENAEEMGLTTSFVITGMQSTSSNYTNDLYLQWKTVDQLIFSSATYVESLYTKYKDNATYLKTLSNSFFLGSQNTYDLDRDVSISNSGNDLTVTLTFTNFADCYYTDSTGKVQSGLQVSNTFKNMSDPDASTSGVNFVDNQQVQSNVSNYANYTPQELINAISDGTVPISNFVTTSGNYTYSTVVMSNDTNDGIVVEVTATSNTRDTTTTSYKYSAIYNGLTTGASSSYIYNYAFSDETDADLQSGLTELRQIPFDQITTQDVLDCYVSKLPIYTGTYKIDFSVNDVTITKNSDYTITVQVVIPSYNSSDTTATTANRTFTTKLNGFLSQTKNNNNSNKDVKDLTIPLSVGFASAIVLVMGAILTHIIIKRKKLSKSKINLKELRKNQKPYKK